MRFEVQRKHVAYAEVRISLVILSNLLLPDTPDSSRSEIFESSTLINNYIYKYTETNIYFNEAKK